MSTTAKPTVQAPAAKPAPTAAPKQPAGKLRRVLSDAEKAKLQQERAAKFRKLGNKRLNRVLKGMKHLENLGRGQYSYTPEQANTLIAKLTDGVAAVKLAFAPKSRGSAAAQELEYL